MQRLWPISWCLLGLVTHQVSWAQSLPERELLDLKDKIFASKLSADLEQEANNLSSRHIRQYERPKSCPLQSNNYQEILNKIQGIQALFKESCLDGDSGRFDQILSGASTLQDQLGQLANQDPDSTAASGGSSSTPDNMTSVDGQNIASVINNMTNVFMNEKCDFDRGSFLEQSADLIQNFAQMGLLVPSANGLAIIGGGMALSSILRLLDSLFDQRFDFETVSDRQSFIKLNCAFWDVRRDIDASGFLDVPGQEHYEDQVEVDHLLKKVEEKITQLRDAEKSFDLLVETTKKKVVADKMGRLQKLEKLVGSSLALIESKIEDGSLPVQTQKLQVIQGLAHLYPQLKQELSHYQSLNLAKIPMLDSLLLQELDALDHSSHPDEFRKLLSLPIHDFNEKFRAGLLFHFKRVQADLGDAQKNFEKKWLEETKIADRSLDVFIKEVKAAAEANYADLGQPQKALVDIETRLARMIGDKSYTGRDDGTENIVNILDIYDQVTEQIYGEWGYEFLKYTTHQADEHNDRFEDLYQDFSSEHLDGGRIPAPEGLDSTRKLFACQDALPARRRWKYSEGLVQQGHDFVVTNKELFHQDVPGLFLSNQGGGFGLHGFRSRYEKIQTHHLSSIYALKILANEDYDRDAADEVLRYRYLGNVMLDVSKSKKKAGVVQELIEQYECQNLVTQD